MMIEISGFHVSCDYKSCTKKVSYYSDHWDKYPIGWRVKTGGLLYVDEWMRWVCPTCFQKMSKKTRYQYKEPPSYSKNDKHPKTQLIEIPLENPILADFLEELGYSEAAERLR